MFARFIFAALLCCNLMSAVEGEERAGLWETTFERQGKAQRLRLALEIVHGGVGTASWVTSQGSVNFQTERGAPWQPVRSCGYLVEPRLQLAGDQISFQCSPPSPQPAAQRWEQVFGFDGRFVKSYSELSGTLLLNGEGVSVIFTRPHESVASPLAGHWTASGAGQTCVLHVYDGAATIDVYSRGQAVFGQPVNITALADGRLEVRWSDIGPISFVGSLDLLGHFHGTWYGRGFRCSEDGPQGIFTRSGIK
jgi:hypothetical protein